MSEARDPVDSLNEDLELLERHISILRTVRDNQPVGLIRLSEMTGIPKHRVRYSLKIMEQQGIIVATPEGAVVSDRYDAFMNDMAASVERLAGRVCELRDALRRTSTRSAGRRPGTWRRASCLRSPLRRTRSVPSCDPPERPYELLRHGRVLTDRRSEADLVQRLDVVRSQIGARHNPWSHRAPL